MQQFVLTFLVSDREGCHLPLYCQQAVRVRRLPRRHRHKGINDAQHLPFYIIFNHLLLLRTCLYGALQALSLSSHI